MVPSAASEVASEHGAKNIFWEPLRVVQFTPNFIGLYLDLSKHRYMGGRFTFTNWEQGWSNVWEVWERPGGSSRSPGLPFPDSAALIVHLCTCFLSSQDRSTAGICPFLPHSLSDFRLYLPYPWGWIVLFIHEEDWSTECFISALFLDVPLLLAFTQPHEDCMAPWFISENCV